MVGLARLWLRGGLPPALAWFRPGLGPPGSGLAPAWLRPGPARRGYGPARLWPLASVRRGSGLGLFRPGLALARLGVVPALASAWPPPCPAPVRPARRGSGARPRPRLALAQAWFWLWFGPALALAWADSGPGWLWPCWLWPCWLWPWAGSGPVRRGSGSGLPGPGPPTAPVWPWLSLRRSLLAPRGIPPAALVSRS